MTSLREEYSKYKNNKNKMINEAAVQWVLENVILLNETFNREALQRLQSSITKFDSIFSPFAAKIPEVKKSLDDAIELMNRITMGEKITKKDGRLKLSDDEKEAIKEPATYMVKYMSVLYNNLSRFFNKDMKVLLDFPLFKKAAENPSTPLKDLADQERMRKALLHALEPSVEAKAILERMYKSMELPTLNYEKIADELLNLSIEELRELTQVDRVPLVASIEKSNKNKQQTTEEAKSTNPKAISESLEEEEEEHQILKEFGEIDQNQIDNVVKGIQRIQGIIRGFPELQELNQALDELRSQAMATIAKGGILSGRKAQTIAATANMVYAFFDKIGELWPKIKPLIPDDRPLTEEEIDNIETLLIRAQGGIMSKIGNWFKTRGIPNLQPTQIAKEIMSVVRLGQENPATKQNPQVAIKAAESLSNFFERLANLKLAPVVSSDGEPITPGKSSATPTIGTQIGIGPEKIDPQYKDVAEKMAQMVGTTTDNEQFIKQFNSLIKGGWKIIPPR